MSMLIEKRFVSPMEGIALLREIFGKKIAYLQACAQNENFIKERRELASRVATFMKMKLQHTMFVHKEGMNILQVLQKASAENPNSPALIDTSLDTFTNLQAYNLAMKYVHVYNKALLWHDIGRVEEFDEDLKPTGVDHAVASREMLEQKKALAMVILVVRNHGYQTNKQMYEMCEKEPLFALFTEEEQKACKLLSLLVRDADKLGNWKTFVRQGINREITQRIKPEIFRNQVSIGSYEMECVRNNMPVDYGKYTNFSGVQVAHLMWSADMAFTTTKEAAIKSGLVDGMLEYMDEVAQDDTALAVQRKEVNALPEYHLFLTQTKGIFDIFQKGGWINKQKDFNIDKRLDTLQTRLNLKNFAVPRVLTNGLRRYNRLFINNFKLNDR